uniref:Uncharacterized protein n=2 Tax=Auxenochlorella protothecoides TaxID=3075 RepID=A0A1D2A1B0_AUXPR
MAFLQCRSGLILARRGWGLSAGFLGVPAARLGMATGPNSEDIVEGLVVNEAGLASNELPVTKAFRDLMHRVAGYNESDLLRQLQESLSADAKPAGEQKPDDPAKIEDNLRLLSETLNVMFALLEDENVPIAENLSDLDLAGLEALRASLNERYSGPNEMVVNTAPPGQLPWEILGVDESRGAIHWAADLTDGRAVAPWRAASLAFATKVRMYQLYCDDPVRNSPAALAAQFGVREQRVHAILALKELEAKALSAALPEDARAALLRVAEEDAELGSDVGVSGEGERHHVILPSYPNYEEMDLAAFSSRLEARLGKPMAEISEADLTPAIAKEVLGLESKEEVEARLAAAEEATLVEEFTSRLAYNLGKEGAGLQRKSRRTHFPRRPPTGWNLVVKPLGQSDEEPYVAEATGGRREPNADEALLLKRQTPRPRRRIL